MTAHELAGKLLAGPDVPVFLGDSEEGSCWVGEPMVVTPDAVSFAYAKRQGIPDRAVYLPLGEYAG